MHSSRSVSTLVVLGATFCAALTTLALALGAVSSAADQGSMHNCPLASRWAIAVWDGPDGTDTDQAASTCGEGSVVAAYNLNPETQMWSRWFVGRPEVSDLATLGSKQGVLVLGSASAAPPTPAATATPTPTITRTPTATPTATPGGAAALVVYLVWVDGVFVDTAELIGDANAAMDDWLDADPGSAAEADAVSRLYDIASDADAMHHEALALHPPQGWEGFHDDVLTMLDTTAQMLGLLAEGADENNIDKLNDAIDLIDDIVDMIADLEVQLEASSLSASSAEAEQGAMHNCPLAGKWAIAVWDGSTTETGQALSACGDGAVAAAYSLNPQTQVWSRWFAGRPEVSDLATLNGLQGILVLGSSEAPTTPTPTASATPSPTSTPTATPTKTATPTATATQG